MILLIKKDICLCCSKKTFAESNVVIILNGKEIPTSDFYKINQNSIESVNILKQKTAIQKYGARANDGVIEITTKKDADIYKSQGDKPVIGI